MNPCNPNCFLCQSCTLNSKLFLLESSRTTICLVESLVIPVLKNEHDDVVQSAGSSCILITYMCVTWKIRTLSLGVFCLCVRVFLFPLWRFGIDLHGWELLIQRNVPLQTRKHTPKFRKRKRLTNAVHMDVLWLQMWVGKHGVSQERASSEDCVCAPGVPVDIQLGPGFINWKVICGWGQPTKH